MRNRLTVGLLLLATPLAARADEVLLRSGRRLVGEIVERTDKSVTLEMAPGRVTVPMASVERLVVGPSALGAFRERAARLAPNDAAGWLALGLWARDAGLATQATSAFERVVAIDPNNEQAQQALGRVRVGDGWLAREDAYRAQGLVPFEGEWITAPERERRIAEREAETKRASERAEADARRAEAEARARQAEAEARRAEAEAAAGQASESAVPWWLWGAHGNTRGGRHGHHGRQSSGDAAKGNPPAPTQPDTRAQPTPTPPAPPAAGSQGAAAAGRAGRRK